MTYIRLLREYLYIYEFKTRAPGCPGRQCRNSVNEAVKVDGGLYIYDQSLSKSYTFMTSQFTLNIQ